MVKKMFYVLALAILLTASVAKANTNNSAGHCFGVAPDLKDENGADGWDIYAPPGFIITSAMVKAGPDCFGNGALYQISGIGTNHVTAVRLCGEGPDCHEISHLEGLITATAPTETPVPPTTTPTVTSTRPPATNTPTLPPAPTGTPTRPTTTPLPTGTPTWALPTGTPTATNTTVPTNTATLTATQPPATATKTAQPTGTSTPPTGSPAPTDTPTNTATGVPPSVTLTPTLTETPTATACMCPEVTATATPTSTTVLCPTLQTETECCMYNNTYNTYTYYGFEDVQRWPENLSTVDLVLIGLLVIGIVGFLACAGFVTYQITWTVRERGRKK